MYIEPAFRQHLEMMVAVATADDQAVEGARLAATLRGSAKDAEALLANLVAGGLLRAQGEDSGSRPAYRLARAPEEIALDEIAAVADGAEPASRSTPSTAAATGTRLLSAAVRQRARSVLAAYTLADVMASSTGASDPAAPAAPPGHEHPQPERLGITVAQLRHHMESGEVPFVLDVRARPDSRWPAPPWAHWIPLEHLAGHLPRRPVHAPLVTVCGLGMRSLIAASYLRACGFRRCDPLIGGLEAWHRACA